MVTGFWRLKECLEGEKRFGRREEEGVWQEVRRVGGRREVEGI